MTATLPILSIGDPRLRVVSRAIEAADLPSVLELGDRMSRTLARFRHEHGWGRAIAAPQVGTALRLVVFDLGNGPFPALNPRMTWRSRETAVVYDDCFSLPGIAAPVERHTSVTLDYEDAGLQPQRIERLPLDLAELVQHELDHLDGVLFVDRITDTRSIVARSMKPAPFGGIRS